MQGTMQNGRQSTTAHNPMLTPHSPPHLHTQHIKRCAHCFDCCTAQVAFLRGQLQYALHQSEEESLDLQRQLAAAQAESASLRDSLRAAGDRSAEQERLVVDLSQTLQQQKTRLQVCVR